MAFANTNYSDVIAAGIESRTGEISDQVLDNNPITAQLKKKGRVKTFSGGHKIVEEMSFAENPNGGAYSGYDTLPVAPADVISASEWTIKQYAVPVVISGLEKIQNSGREGIIDLLEGRLEVAESTMANIFETDAYGDGTNYGGKALDGLAKIVESQADASQTATVGGISRTTWAFWRSHYVSAATGTAAACQAAFTSMVADLTRGADKPDFIVLGATLWGDYLASLQAIQRFTNSDSADLGFPTVSFMGIPVYLGGGMGGVMDATHGLFLNSKYLRLRPFSGRNFTTLDPTRRWALNQDAECQILAWAGNITCRGSKFQGRLVSSD